ncbi:MAG: hypothetical protein HYY05_05015 [Chloroflexi bacterium]|nr:hypothetical protein [Chloroflexota bacterium]
MMLEVETKLAPGALARVTRQTDLLDRPDVGGPEMEQAGTLAMSSRVRVISEIGDWVQVEMMGLRGYVRREALELA